MDLPNTSGIYAITNTANGKQYVGSAANLRGRWQTHLSQLRTQHHHNCYLQHAFNQDGESVFTLTVLETCVRNELLEREQHWMDTLHTIRPNGYNLRPRAESNLGYKYTADQVLRASAAARLKFTDPEMRARHAQGLREAWERPGAHEQRAEGIRNSWEDPTVRESRIAGQKRTFSTPQSQATRGAATKAGWDDPVTRERRSQGISTALNEPEALERRAQAMRERYAEPGAREQQGQRMRAALASPDIRQAMRERSRAHWADPVYREKVLTARREAAARRKAAKDLQL